MESVGRNKMSDLESQLSQKSLSAWRAWVEILESVTLCLENLSLSAWRAWVEINPACSTLAIAGDVALRMESVGRNIFCRCAVVCRYWSLSAWRAWVEIPRLRCHCGREPVALRMESVGRNNNSVETVALNTAVALRMESVGRNQLNVVLVSCRSLSLSAWRAWVEIQTRTETRPKTPVALRMESVGRNIAPPSTVVNISAMSLSAWRAWVEITYYYSNSRGRPVALRMESVGRNSHMVIMTTEKIPVALRMESVGRNVWNTSKIFFAIWSLSAWRAWVEICPGVSRAGGKGSRSPHGERG